MATIQSWKDDCSIVLCEDVDGDLTQNCSIVPVSGSYNGLEPSAMVSVFLYML